AGAAGAAAGAAGGTAGARNEAWTTWESSRGGAGAGSGTGLPRTTGGPRETAGVVACAAGGGAPPAPTAPPPRHHPSRQPARPPKCVSWALSRKSGDPGPAAGPSVEPRPGSWLSAPGGGGIARGRSCQGRAGFTLSVSARRTGAEQTFGKSATLPALTEGAQSAQPTKFGYAVRPGPRTLRAPRRPGRREIGLS